MLRRLKENVLPLWHKHCRLFPLTNQLNSQYLLSMTGRHHPPLLVFLQLVYLVCLISPPASLSPTSPRYTPPLLFIIALALWDPLVRSGITHTLFKGTELQPGLCHQFTLFLLSSAGTRNAKLLPHESVWAPQWERVLVISGPEQRAREGWRD